MRRQKNTQQVKEQGKNPPDQTNEEEVGSLPEKEFRVMVLRMIQNLGNRMEKIQETLNKDLEELKKKTMINAPFTKLISQIHFQLLQKNYKAISSSTLRELIGTKYSQII